MKACPRCGFACNDRVYCPDCRRRGNIVLMKSKSQLSMNIERLRKQAQLIMDAMAKLDGEG